MSNICKIMSHPHYVEYIRGMGSADNCKTKISNASYKHLIQNGYSSSKKVKYIAHMLWWEIVQMFHKVDIIWMQIIRSDPLFWKADVCRKLDV